MSLDFLKSDTNIHSMDRLIPRTHRSQIAWEVEASNVQGTQELLGQTFPGILLLPNGVA